MTEIKPIETHYKGYRFRSRLEARWAVLFDALGIPWEYEPEGYVTDRGPYLPDFRLWQQIPAEVKRQYSYEESCSVELMLPWMRKVAAMTRLIQGNVLVLMGVPEVRWYPAWTPDLMSRLLDFGASAVEGRPCYHSGGVWNTERAMPPADELAHRGRMQQAVYAARSARFEHGEEGPRNTGPMRLADILQRVGGAR